MMSMGQPKFLTSMSHMHTDRQTNGHTLLTYPRILISSHNGCPMLIILRVNDENDLSWIGLLVIFGILSLSMPNLGKVCLGPTLTSTPLKSLLMEEGMSFSLGFMSRMIESPLLGPAFGFMSIGLLESQSG